LPHETIGAELGVARNTITQWLNGDRNPSPTRRKTIAKKFGVPADAWDRKPRAARATAAGAGVRSEEAQTLAVVAESGPIARFDAEARLRAQLSRLDAERAAGSKRGHQLPPQIRMRLEATETRCIELLGKLTGEGQEIGESRIVRLPAWRRIQDAIIGALRPWPEASVAVMKALQELGA
jgi:transcriptional regulator with XRE-family HTH domain